MEIQLTKKDVETGFGYLTPYGFKLLVRLAAKESGNPVTIRTDGTTGWERTWLIGVMRKRFGMTGKVE